MARVEEAVRVAAEFAGAFNRHDAQGIVGLCDDGCVFEDFREGPEGGRLVGKAEVAAFFEKIFAGQEGLRLVTEELVGNGPRCFLRWKLERQGGGPLRGIDVFDVRMGKIRERLSYARLP
jgi:ketosteroid isomerase-like protein